MATVLPRNPTILEALAQAGSLALPGLAQGAQGRLRAQDLQTLDRFQQQQQAFGQFQQQLGVAEVARQQGLTGQQPQDAIGQVQPEFPAFVPQPQLPQLRTAFGQQLGAQQIDPLRQAQIESLQAQTAQRQPLLTQKERRGSALLEIEKTQSEIAKNRASEIASLKKASGGVLTEKDKIQTAATLRKEFNGLSDDFRKINDSFERIKAASDDPSAAGDLAIIFNFMKILDPGSVVRESEFATAENAAGVPDKIRNLWNKAVSGERIAFNRSDFVNQATNLLRSQQRVQKKLVNRYSGLARRAGVEPQNVVADVNILPQRQRNAAGGFGGIVSQPVPTRQNLTPADLDNLTLEQLQGL